MEDNLKQQILELIEELNAKTYSRGENWKGYEVYVPVYEKEMYMGLPYVVLVKDGEARISTPEESLEYLDFANPEFKPDNKLYK